MDVHCTLNLIPSYEIKAVKASPAEAAHPFYYFIVFFDPYTLSILISSYRLSDNYIKKRIQHFLDSRQEGRLGIPRDHQSKTIVVDFSSPNIAKEMHVGHLRSTIIGDCIARAHEFLGNKVIRLNHIGDWGTQFGMMINYLKVAHPDIYETLQRGEPLSSDAHMQLDLISLYKTARKMFEANEGNFQELSRAEVVRLQSGDESSRKVWMFLCNISRIEFQKIYDLLNVRLEERGESFYNPFLPGLVGSLINSGVAGKSEGAIVAYAEDLPKDVIAESDPTARALVLQKTDGGYLYATTDLAALRYRLTDGEGEERGDGADEVLYVTDAGQATHFDMVFTVARRAALIPPNKIVRHVPFGVVLGVDGKKLKSRSGDTVKLKDLLSEAIGHAERAVSVKNSENRFNFRQVHLREMSILRRNWQKK